MLGNKKRHQSYFLLTIPWKIKAVVSQVCSPWQLLTRQRQVPVCHSHWPRSSSCDQSHEGTSSWQPVARGCDAQQTGAFEFSHTREELHPWCTYNNITLSEKRKIFSEVASTGSCHVLCLSLLHEADPHPCWRQWLLHTLQHMAAAEHLGLCLCKCS